VINLSIAQRQKLLASWGERADSLAATAELRVYDPLSCWECFIYALNPDDQDEIACILHGFTVETCNWRLSELASHFNANGEAPIVDKEYRSREANVILKMLRDYDS
jgi:hypothetical protein